MPYIIVAIVDYIIPMLTILYTIHICSYHILLTIHRFYNAIHDYTDIGSASFKDLVTVAEENLTKQTADVLLEDQPQPLELVKQSTKSENSTQTKQLN